MARRSYDEDDLGPSRTPKKVHEEIETDLVYDAEHWLMSEEAYKVFYDLPVRRAFSDMDLEPYLRDMAVVDSVFRQILTGD